MAKGFTDGELKLARQIRGQNCILKVSNSISLGWVKSCENKYKVTRPNMHFGREHYYRTMQRANLTKSSGYSGRNTITTFVLRPGLNTGAESMTDPSRKVQAALCLGDKTLWQLTLTQKTKENLQSSLINHQLSLTIISQIERPPSLSRPTL